MFLFLFSDFRFLFEKWDIILNRERYYSMREEDGIKNTYCDFIYFYYIKQRKV